VPKPVTSGVRFEHPALGPGLEVPGRSTKRLFDYRRYSVASMLVRTLADIVGERQLLGILGKAPKTKSCSI